jgi:hypothetical protein
MSSHKAPPRWHLVGSAIITVLLLAGIIGLMAAYAGNQATSSKQLPAFYGKVAEKRDIRGAVLFTYTVRNDTTGVLKNIVVLFDGNVKPSGAPSVKLDYNASLGGLGWRIPRLPKGATRSVTIPIAVPKKAGTEFCAGATLGVVGFWWSTARTEPCYNVLN